MPALLEPARQHRCEMAVPLDELLELLAVGADRRDGALVAIEVRLPLGRTGPLEEPSGRGAAYQAACAGKLRGGERARGVEPVPSGRWATGWVAAGDTSIPARGPPIWAPGRGAHSASRRPSAAGMRIRVVQSVVFFLEKDT